jgi:hypothetical protein
MRAASFLLVVCAMACRDEPKTTFLNDRRAVRTWFEKECGTVGYSYSRDRVDWSSSPHERGTSTFLCSFRGMPAAQITVTGVSYSEGRMCRVQIGPSVLHRPLPLDFLQHLIADDRLRTKIEAALGQLDPQQLYFLDLFVDGVSVYASQQRASFNTVLFELDLNGCDRSPRDSSHDHWFHYGPFELQLKVPSPTRPAN